MRNPFHLLAVLVLLVVAVGCNGDDDTSDLIEVIFDGNGCTISNPSTVPAGDRGFVITNNSDEVPIRDLNLWVASLLDGHVFQDIVDLQDEAGGSPNSFQPPSWFAPETWISSEYFNRPEVSTPELTDNQALEARMLTEGNDAVWLVASAPRRLWLCAPLEVNAQQDIESQRYPPNIPPLISPA